MLILGFALSLLVGVSLGFFGGGGSILTVPLFVYVFALEPKAAIASSLVVVGIASSSAAVQHWRAGNVRLKAGLVFGGAGMIGAYLGGRASEFVDGGFLLLLFAAMMLLTAAAMWRGRSGYASAAETEPAPLRLIAQGFSVGAFTGLVGAGGGFLIVPALALWSGLPLPAAVGTSLLIIVLNTLSAFLGYASHVAIDTRLVASVAGCAIAGSLAGSRLARSVAPEPLRRAFAAFVLVMACAILVREATLLARTASEALPRSWPQLAFSLAMLGMGLFAGRTSKRAARRSSHELAFHEGAGI